MKLLKQLIFIAMLIFIPLSCSAADTSNWVLSDSGQGFTVMLPPGWIGIPMESKNSAMGYGIPGNDDISIMIQVMENPMGRAFSESELLQGLNSYNEPGGVILIGEPTYGSDYVIGVGTRPNGKLVSEIFRTTINKMIIGEADFSNTDDLKYYSDIFGTIFGTLIITEAADEYQQSYEVSPTYEPTYESRSSGSSKENSIVDKIQWKHVSDGQGSYYTVPFNWDVETSPGSVRVTTPDKYCSSTFSTIKLDNDEEFYLFDENVGLEIAKNLDSESYEFDYDYSNYSYDPQLKLFMIPVNSIRNDGINRYLSILPKYPAFVCFFFEMDSFIDPALSDEYTFILGYIASNVDKK